MEDRERRGLTHSPTPPNPSILVLERPNLVRKSPFAEFERHMVDDEEEEGRGEDEGDVGG